MTTKLAFIVPASDLYCLKSAVTELINKYQAKENLNGLNIAETQVLRKLIELEHHTNLDNYQTTFVK